MKPIGNRRKGPLDFSTLNFNSSYFASNEDDLYLSIHNQTDTKYKFELGGLLVYDYKAKIVKESDTVLEPLSQIEEKPSAAHSNISKSGHSGNK